VAAPSFETHRWRDAPQDEGGSIANAPPPVFFAAPGTPYCDCPLRTSRGSVPRKCEGMERRLAHLEMSRLIGGGAPCDRRASPPGAPRAAVCVPCSRASGRRRGPPVGPRSGAVPAAPSSPPRAALCSEERWAAGLNAGGRPGGASRERACEARARAPRSPKQVAPLRPRPGLSAASPAPPDRAAPPQDRL
jgi:hypothetical protein